MKLRNSHEIRKTTNFIKEKSMAFLLPHLRCGSFVENLYLGCVVFFGETWTRSSYIVGIGSGRVSVI